MGLRLLAASALVCVLTDGNAQTGTVANLPLTCPNAAAIGQPQNSCGGLSYQSPTSDQLIVLRSNGTWARAASLDRHDTLATCGLPVQPGTYSSCRDSSGVRQIVYWQKIWLFTSSTPAPSTGAQTLDLSRVPVEITVPGLYVIDRNWLTYGNGAAIVVAADNVTLDLQGFELSVESVGIASTGQNVTIRNGRVVGQSVLQSPFLELAR